MLIAVHIAIQFGLIIRTLLRPHRDPASRLAWVSVILGLPVAGIVGYLLLGETNIGRKRVERMKKVIASMPDPELLPAPDTAVSGPVIHPSHEALFKTGRSISGFEPVDGNSAELMADSNAAIDRMIADIDAAEEHVHLLFYIWMPDNSGRKMAQALIRAAARGVTCRAAVDDLGSRLLLKSDVWAAMGSGGVRLARSLQIGNPLLRIFDGRIDMRNHRKIVVIDSDITYCGSQNCADPEFATKARYAPWVDMMVRFKGPVARQHQQIFVEDWMASVDEDIRDVLFEPIAAQDGGFPAQVVASGPTARYSAAPEMFETLLYSARREIFITTPYYAPVSSLQAAICAAANRGVETTIIFPARNDDFAVGATSRSYYEDLLSCGVRIYEYQAGLLHTKSLTMDAEVTFVGSANMDRRSFELNYENNILLCDEAFTGTVRARQQAYLGDSRRVTAVEVADWPWHRRLRQNTLAILSPLL